MYDDHIMFMLTYVAFVVASLSIYRLNSLFFICTANMEFYLAVGRLE